MRSLLELVRALVDESRASLPRSWPASLRALHRECESPNSNSTVVAVISIAIELEDGICR